MSGGHWSRMEQAAEVRAKISRNRRRLVRPEVVCPCGAAFEAKHWGGRLQRFCSQTRLYRFGARTGAKNSIAGRERVSQMMTGADNHRWRGGVSSLRVRLANTPEYKAWRKAVFERDDYTCQQCRRRGVRLQADHIVPVAERPDLILVVTNGQTLCRPCHWDKTRADTRRDMQIAMLAVLMPQ